MVVDEVPWGNGKHQLTNAYMLFLARWARLSRKETAEAFFYVNLTSFLAASP